MDFNSKCYILNIFINNDTELMKFGTPKLCGWVYDFQSTVEIGLFNAIPNIKSHLFYVS